MLDVFLKEDLYQRRWLQRNHHLPNDCHFEYSIQIPCQMDRMRAGGEDEWGKDQ